MITTLRSVRRKARRRWWARRRTSCRRTRRRWRARRRKGRRRARRHRWMRSRMRRRGARRHRWMRGRLIAVDKETVVYVDYDENAVRSCKLRWAGSKNVQELEQDNRCKNGRCVCEKCSLMLMWSKKSFASCRNKFQIVSRWNWNKSLISNTRLLASQKWILLATSCRDYSYGCVPG